MLFYNLGILLGIFMMLFKFKFCKLFFEEDWIVLVFLEVLVYLYFLLENIYLISYIIIVFI